MDRSHMINEYTADNDIAKRLMGDASNYLDELKFRVKGSKTVEELEKETKTFLNNNPNLPIELREGIERIINNFNENTNVYSAQLELESFLSNNYDSKESDFNKTNDALLDVKKELMDDTSRRLENDGISFNGSSDTYDEVINNIQDKDDVERIDDNVTRVNDYIYENSKDNDNKPTDINIVSEVDMGITNKILESSNDDVLLNAVLDNHENNNNNSNSNNLFEVKEDGSIQINGDTTNPESMNFTNMMIAYLVANDETLGYKLDMKFIKQNEDVNNFKVLLGNFPVADRPQNSLDPMAIQKIEELANSYKSDADYGYLLENQSSEIFTAISIIQEKVMNTPGAFQLAVNNNGETANMAIAIDSNYPEVIESFSENGAIITEQGEEYVTFMLPDTLTKEQANILANVLDQLKYGANQKIKEPDTGNVNLSLLVLATLAEIVLVGVYIFFIR